MSNLEGICNNNPKNMPSDIVYNNFNEFIFSNDTKLLGKLLHRFEYFNKIKDLPGDIVELGVFKGSGIATFSKFLDIYCPNSNKKVIGFDIFDPENSNDILEKDGNFDKDNMNIVYSKVSSSELLLENVIKRLDAMEIHKKYMLVKGDVEETLPKFLNDNPGFRISMLYIDVDLDRPTYYGLKYLWDRILPGGVVLFDEYEYHKFSESNGVDRFLQEKGLPYDLKSTNWIAPSAYLIKK
jgi:hypothetical protein